MLLAEYAWSLYENLSSLSWNLFILFWELSKHQYQARQELFTLWCATGWSFATDIFHIVLTGTKKQRNGKTQPFLLTLDIDVSIFWCLSIVRWKQVVPFRAVLKQCFGSILQDLQTHIPAKHIRLPPISMNTTQKHPDTHQTSPRHSDVFGGYLGSQSLHYGATTLFWHSLGRHDLFSPD